MDTRATTELRAIYQPIEPEICRLRARLDREFASTDPFIGQVLKQVAEYRGKQIRPALLFLVSRLSGAQPTDDHIQIACAIELIHTATLVHDDILDDAELRRKVETVHRSWGERPAILIGDYIYSRAFHLSTGVPGMARILSDTTHTICEGELLQISSRFRPNMGESTYFEIIRKKTAVLHAVSCQLGGVLGDLDSEQCRSFYEFGLDLGMAFQIVDDCLDYTGTEAQVGKSLGSDLHQGKVTLPLIYLMERLSEAEGRWLTETLRAQLSERDEHRIHSLVEQHGVAREALARADSFLHSARARLAAIVVGTPMAKQARESLELAAGYILRRRR
jgi:octaprenyl-diphosphate synthase